MNLENLKTAKILKLSLKKQPFDVMVTGEKQIEIRRPSNWLKSRLYNKDGSDRDYDYVQFTNGYGADKPMFIVEYLYFFEADEGITTTWNFSNGLSVDINDKDVIIVLGNVLHKQNLTLLAK